MAEPLDELRDSLTGDLLVEIAVRTKHASVAGLTLNDVVLAAAAGDGSEARRFGSVAAGEGGALRRNHVRIELGAVLRCPLERLEVHVHQAEARPRSQQRRDGRAA